MTGETTIAGTQEPISSVSSVIGSITSSEIQDDENVLTEDNRFTPSTAEVVLTAAESSTAATPTPLNLYVWIEGLFERARGLDFEDGIHSQFSRDLMGLVQKSGVSAVEVIAALIVHGKVNSSIAAEALFWLARIKQGRTYKFRLWLLETCLQSPSPRIRDAAALGLVTMGDQHSLEPIKRAVEQENCEELKTDLQKAVDQLEQQCRLF